MFLLNCVFVVYSLIDDDQAANFEFKVTVDLPDGHPENRSYSCE